MAEPVVFAPPLAEVPLPARERRRPSATQRSRRRATPAAPPFASATGCGPTESFSLEAERFAALYRARLDPDRPPHVAVLLDNTPDYVFALVRRRARGSGAGRAEPHPARRAPGSRHLAHRRPAPDHRASPPGAARNRPSTGWTCRAASSSPSASPTPTIRPCRWVSRWTMRSTSPGSGTEPATARNLAVGDGVRARCPVGAAVHVGHLRRPEGGALHPAPAADDGPADGHDARHRPRRRRVRGHAPVPRQLVDVGSGAGAGRRRIALPGPPLQRIAVPPRRPALRSHLVQLHGQGAGLPVGHARARRRRRQHLEDRLRQRRVAPRRGSGGQALRYHHRRRLRFD